MNFNDYVNIKPYASSKSNPEIHAAHRDEDARLYAKFKADMFDELGISGHPNAEKLFVIAWDLGHSSGYSAVFNYADELSELLK